MKIADCHVHIGYFPSAKKNNKEFYYSPEYILNALHKSNIQEFIFSSFDILLFQEDISFVQDEIKQMLEISQGNGYAFAWITLEMIKKDANLNCLNNLPYSGIKLHPRESQWHNNSRELDRIFSISKEKNFSIMIHADEDYPPDIYEYFLKLYPNVKVNFAHARPINKIINIMKKYPQTYTDISFMSIDNIKFFYKEPDIISRIMFGSDIPAPARFFEQNITQYLKVRLNELLTIGEINYEDLFYNNMKKFIEL